MRRAILIALAAGLLAAQTGVDIEQLRVRGAGEVLVRIGAGFFNVRAAELEGLTVIPGTPPVLRVTAVPSAEALSAGQRAEVAAMIAAAPQPSISPGYVNYYPTTPMADFTVPETFIQGSLEVYSNGIRQSEGPEGVGHYELTTPTMVHFWPATVPHGTWWVHLAWVSQPF